MQANANGAGASTDVFETESGAATANGRDSSAEVIDTENSFATANGRDSVASAQLGLNNTATANGNSSNATAGGTSHINNGSNDTALARGGCTASALGDNLTVTCHP